MGTTTATAIFPLLLSPPLEPPLGLIAGSDDVVDAGTSWELVPEFVADRVTVSNTKLVCCVCVGASLGLELIGGGVEAELLGGASEVTGGGVEVLDGGGASLLIDVVVGGGGVSEVVVGGAGVEEELGGGGELVEVGSAGGEVGAADDEVSTSPPPELVALDMTKVWRFRRGSCLYGSAMVSFSVPYADRAGRRGLHYVAKTNKKGSGYNGR
jgi:hypothetical protein